MNKRTLFALTAPLLFCQCMQCYFDKVNTVATEMSADGKIRCELGVGEHSIRITLKNESDEEILVDKNGEYCIKLKLRGKNGWPVPMETCTDVVYGDEVHASVTETVKPSEYPLKKCFTRLAPGQSTTYTYCEGHNVYGFQYFPTTASESAIWSGWERVLSDEAEKCAWRMPKIKDITHVWVEYGGYGTFFRKAEGRSWLQETRNAQTLPENAYTGYFRLYWKKNTDREVSKSND